MRSNWKEIANRIPDELKEEAKQHFKQIDQLEINRSSLLWLEQFFIKHISDQYIKRGVLKCANERQMLTNIIRDCVTKVWV